MKERKLNYRFHNPNPAVVTADYILKVLIEANTGKVDTAIRNAAAAISDEGKTDGRREGHSA